MVKSGCCEKTGLNKGKWTAEEDEKLVTYIKANGGGSWRTLPKNAGLLRCGKSCRLRWVNYLRDDVKRGNFTGDEEESIVKLHKIFGNKWSLIASHLSGRTDNEIKNYWNSHLSRRIYRFRSIKLTEEEMISAGAADKTLVPMITHAGDSKKKKSLSTWGASRMEKSNGKEIMDEESYGYHATASEVNPFERCHEPNTIGIDDEGIVRRSGGSGHQEEEVVAEWGSEGDDGISLDLDQFVGGGGDTAMKKKEVIMENTNHGDCESWDVLCACSLSSPMPWPCNSSCCNNIINVYGTAGEEFDLWSETEGVEELMIWSYAENQRK